MESFKYELTFSKTEGAVLLTGAPRKSSREWDLLENEGTALFYRCAQGRSLRRSHCLLHLCAKFSDFCGARVSWREMTENIFC